MYKTIVSLILWPIWFVYMLISLIILFVALYIVPRRHLYFLIRVWCWGACFFAGQWLIKKGNLPDLDGEPYLYMFNHVSLFDQFMVAAFIGHYVTVVGAVEQFRWPIWGTVGRKYGAIPIMRKQIKKAVNALNAAEEAIKKGVSIMIAPEGTRTITGEINDFKKQSKIDRLVMVWCGSTEIFLKSNKVHKTINSFEKGLKNNDKNISPSMIYAYAAIKCGAAYANGAPNLSADIPALIELSKKKQCTNLWERF